jgi:hypothetical protein
MRHCWNKNAFWDVNNMKWRKWWKYVSHFLFINTYGLPALTTDTRYSDQVFYVWLIDLQTICAKYVLETWFSPNDDIRKCLLDVKRGSNKNAFWDVNNKKWRKWFKFVSPFLFNNTYGLTVPTMDTKFSNQVFYVWLVDFQTIRAKEVLETWLSPNNDIELYLLDMQRSWTKNARWNLKSGKWRKWSKYISPLLFNNTYGLTVLTVDTKCPFKYFMFDWSIYKNFVLNRGWKLDSLQILVYVCSTCSVVELIAQVENWKNDTGICLRVMNHSWTKNAFWYVNNMKWRKWCKVWCTFLI